MAVRVLVVVLAVLLWLGDAEAVGGGAGGGGGLGNEPPEMYQFFESGYTPYLASVVRTGCAGYALKLIPPLLVMAQPCLPACTPTMPN